MPNLNYVDLLEQNLEKANELVKAQERLIEEKDRYIEVLNKQIEELIWDKVLLSKALSYEMAKKKGL